MGGAVGIRANGPEDIGEIKQAVDLPVIGLNKRTIPGSAIYITPELEDVQQILGADLWWSGEPSPALNSLPKNSSRP
jgi:N-acylglucosamine-6-phosphate 2-epimerase